MTAWNHHKIPLNFSNAHSINLRILRSWFTPGQYRRKYSDTPNDPINPRNTGHVEMSHVISSEPNQNYELNSDVDHLFLSLPGMVQCENGSVLHLQFWFVCKSKSRTLFLTLPSGFIQECSRFINKSGFIMIWSILAHWSFNQSNCL